ncbi:MAG: hypothetical protein V7638_4152 [Acidobacteriota bacterium]
MKNTKRARLFESSLLIMVISFLTLFSPCPGKAQNNSTVNLAGTVWNKSPQFVEFPSDGTFATLRHGYAFERKGKVKYALSTIKPAGQESRHGYNSITGRVELITVPTMPLNTFQIFDGTYEINGRSIYLHFPAYTVSATIYSDSLKGELTYKKTNKKEEWIVRRQSNPSNEPIGGGKFSAPADSPMIGTWKYVEYSDKRKVIRTSTFIYSPNGVVESIHQVGTDTIETKNNWKYTAKSPKSGVLEEFSGDDLVERGNVKFGTGNVIVSLEYTVTFSKDSSVVGHQSTWIKQVRFPATRKVAKIMFSGRMSQRPKPI